MPQAVPCVRRLEHYLGFTALVLRLHSLPQQQQRMPQAVGDLSAQPQARPGAHS